MKNMVDSIILHPIKRINRERDCKMQYDYYSSIKFSCWFSSIFLSKTKVPMAFIFTVKERY